jgi:hypothetical protein
MMLRKALFTSLLAALAVSLPAASGGELPAASQWIPADALLVLEVSHPKPLLDLLLSPQLAATITAMPAYQSQANEAGFKQFLGGLALVEFQVNTDWRSALRKLTGGGLTLAIEPNGALLATVDSDDPELLARLNGVFANFAKGGTKQPNGSDPTAPVEYAGASYRSFGNGEAHAILGRRLLFSNRAETLKAALDLRNGKGKCIAATPGYEAAHTASDPKAVAAMYVNLAQINRSPATQAALKIEQPLIALLLAGLTEPLRQSTWAAVTLDVEGQSLVLNATADGPAAGQGGLASFACPAKSDEGAMPNLVVPRRIAAATLYRDLHGFYASKDKLFPERTSGLIFFENMMGIFFTGRDLTEEVLIETKPEIRLVVAQQAYKPEIGTPEVQFPAFAAVFRMRNPEKTNEMTEEAWQKVIGLMNFTRGQQALPGLIIDRDSYEGTRFSLAYFSATGEKSKADLPVRFNFRPTIARLDDALVLSSTDGLARDILAALNQENQNRPKPLAVGSQVELDGPRLAAILQVNRKSLVAQNMIEKGMTQEQAEAQASLLAAVCKCLGQARFELGIQQGRAEARLKLKLNLDGR